MSLKSIITDKQSGESADVTCNGYGCALSVATHPLVEKEDKLLFFTNATEGIEMNKDASFGGTPDKVHDGTDSVLWTGANVVGANATFNSAAQAHAGATSVLVTTPTAGDIFEFDKAADINLNNYVALTMWIYVDGNWGDGDSTEVYGYDDGAGLTVGVAVNLEDYFNPAVTGTWQKISIPLEDMALTTATTVDRLRFAQVSTLAVKPTYYLDDIQFEETGTPLNYDVEPEKGTWFHVRKLMVFYADAYTGTLADATMPKIPYDGFFGVSALDTGIVYQRIIEDDTKTTYAIKQHSDFMNFSDATVSGYGSDGTNSWVSIKINFASEIILRPENFDKLRLQITEDLSGLLSFRISVGGFIEYRD